MLSKNDAGYLPLLVTVSGLKAMILGECPQCSEIVSGGQIHANISSEYA